MRLHKNLVIMIRGQMIKNNTTFQRGGYFINILILVTECAPI